MPHAASFGRLRTEPKKEEVEPRRAGSIHFAYICGCQAAAVRRRRVGSIHEGLLLAPTPGLCDLNGAACGVFSVASFRVRSAVCPCESAANLRLSGDVADAPCVYVQKQKVAVG